MDKKLLNKKFPSYFKSISDTYNIELPPSDAVNEPPVEVYRACPTQKIEKMSFLNSYEENDFKPFIGREDNPSSYSLSLYTKFSGVKRFTKVNRVYPHPCLIAKGTIDSNMGVWKFTPKSTHIDFWQYEGIPVWEKFSEFKESDLNVDNK
ncbi:MAG: hypothetical protein UH239_04855 [Acutalibacteraceae bacterium]|nr:hypothetical protein [Acutalibacteraceae bacterium]